MKEKAIRVKVENFDASFYGTWVALGIAWHLDAGFWNILINAFLGWIYVAYKLAQYIWPFG